MKSLYKLTQELNDAVRMLEDSLNAWGTPNGWDGVKADLEEALRQSKSLSEHDIPDAVSTRSLDELVLNVLDVQGNGEGRFAELELFKRLKCRKHPFTIQGPTSLIYVEKGLLAFRTIKASETFSGRFLAYHVGRPVTRNPWKMSV